MLKNKIHLIYRILFISRSIMVHTNIQKQHLHHSSIPEVNAEKICEMKAIIQRVTQASVTGLFGIMVMFCNLQCVIFQFYPRLLSESHVDLDSFMWNNNPYFFIKCSIDHDRLLFKHTCDKMETPKLYMSLKNT